MVVDGWWCFNEAGSWWTRKQAVRAKVMNHLIQLQ